jgi:asparagine synthase (glutamine-hydrolysing)
MTVLEDQGHITLAVKGLRPLRCGAHGVILGTLFRRADRRAVDALTWEEQEAIAASQGQYLIEAFWGPYVAFIHQRDTGTSIIRAPWGDLPCYRFERDGVIFLASDVDLLVHCAGYRPSVAWEVAVRQLAHGSFYHQATCLEGIEQLPGGERTTIVDGSEHRDPLWSPWNFAAGECQITDSGAAVDLVRETALTCIAARASSFERVMVTLSGGLDPPSSLRPSPPDVPMFPR